MTSSVSNVLASTTWTREVCYGGQRTSISILVKFKYICKEEENDESNFTAQDQKKGE